MGIKREVMIIPTNKMADYWTVVILILIIYAASYYLVYCVKISKRIFPDKLTFHFNLALMNVYEPKNKRLLRWKNIDIEIVKVIPTLITSCITTCWGGGRTYIQL